MLKNFIHFIGWWLCRSHAATLPEWLDQPPSHSARVAPATQPLCQSGWKSHSATQRSATLPRSGWVAEWLSGWSGWVADAGRAAEWLSGWGENFRHCAFNPKSGCDLPDDFVMFCNMTGWVKHYCWVSCVSTFCLPAPKAAASGHAGTRLDSQGPAHDHAGTPWEDFTRITTRSSHKNHPTRKFASKCRPPDRSRDRDPHFVRACATEMHMDMSQEPSHARIHRKNAPQTHAASFFPSLRNRNVYGYVRRRTILRVNL